MGVQCHQRRTSLALDPSTPSIQIIQAGSNSRDARLRQYTAGVQRNRKDQHLSLSRTTFLRSKEGNGQKKSNPRPFHPKRLHLLPSIPHDNCGTSPNNVTSRLMDNIARLNGSVLPRSHPPRLPEVPRLSPRFPEVPISGLTFRTQYSPESFHTSHKGDSSLPKGKGDHGCSLPGRLANLGGFAPQVLYRKGRGTTRTRQARFQGQYSKISSCSSSGFRMARSRLGDQAHSSESTPIQEGPDSSDYQVFPGGSEDVEEVFREGAGQAPARFHCRPSGEDRFEVHQLLHGQVRQEGLEGQETTYPSIAKESPSEMARHFSTEEESQVETSSCITGDPHGRLPSGMGSSFLRHETSIRSMVAEILKVPHQYLGTSDSFPSNQKTQSPKRLSRQSSLRQHDSCSLSEAGGLSQISTPEQLGIDHPDSSGEKGPPSISLSRCGSPERDSRRSLSPEGSGDRVGSGPEFVRLDLQAGGCPGGRSICHSGKHETLEVCVSSRRPNSSSSGCLQLGLEQMEEDLPLSALEPDFEGFEQIGDFRRNSGPDSSSLARTAVVPTVEVPGQGVLPSTSPGLITEGGGSDLLLFCKSDPPPSRLDFLRRVQPDDLSALSVNDWLGQHRASSLRQYESCWTSFVYFIKIKEISTINRESFAAFLRYLFHDKRLAPQSIASYKTALASPLSLGWGIDVSDDLFKGTLKAFSLRRPAPPARSIDWSLDKVLELLEQPEWNVSSIDICLSRCIFLLSLATGSRISELHALQRGREFMFFDDLDTSVTLFSQFNFLAKNEDPLHRRDPILIMGLVDEDGSPHTLCPVKALKDYLNVTHSVTEGPLFVHPASDRPLSKKVCAIKLCQVIKASQPGVFPQSHDCRKMATSLAFFRSMHLEELCQRVGWSSSSVFIKHYLSRIKEVIRDCVVIGRANS